MANNVAASMKASIIIDKKEIISSALSAYAEAQKEIAGNKIELFVDVSDDKARERLKEISKELAGKDYVIKFKNQGIEETMKSLDELFGRIKDVINLSNGININPINLDANIHALQQEEAELKKVTDSYEKLLDLKHKIKNVNKSSYSGKHNTDWIGIYSSQEEAITNELADNKQKLHSSINLILSEDKNALSALEEEANRLKIALQSVQDMVNRISSNSSLAHLDENKGSEEWYKGYAEAYKAIDDRLAELHSQYRLTNEELEEYVTLQIKAEKIMEKMVSNNGGVQASGASSKAELKSWIEKSFARDLGLNPDDIYDGLFGNITDAMYGSGIGISLFDAEGTKRNLRELSAEVLKYKSVTSVFDGAFGANEDAERLREISSILTYIKKNMSEIESTDFSAQIKQATDNVEYFSKKLAEGEHTDFYSEALETAQKELQELIELQERLNVTKRQDTDVIQTPTSNAVEQLEKQEQQALATAQAEEKLAETEKNLAKSTSTVDDSKFDELKADVTEIREELNGVKEKISAIDSEGFEHVKADVEKTVESVKELNNELTEMKSKLDSASTSPVETNISSGEILPTQELDSAVKKYQEIVALVKEYYELSHKLQKPTKEFQTRPEDYDRIDGYLLSKSTSQKVGHTDIERDINKRYHEMSKGINEGKEFAIKAMKSAIQSYWSDVTEMPSDDRLLSSRKTIPYGNKNQKEEYIIPKKYQELEKSVIEETIALNKNNVAYEEERQQIEANNTAIKERMNIIRSMLKSEPKNKDYDGDYRMGLSLKANDGKTDIFNMTQSMSYEDMLKEICNMLGVEIPKGSEKAQSALKEVADVQKTQSSTPIKDTFQGDVKASSESSAPAIKDEAKAMEQVAESAEKASKGKDEFAKANKKVKESADSSSKAVSKETSEFNKIIGKLDGYNTKLANFTVKPANGNRYPIYQKNIDDLTEKINKLQVLSEKDINLINTNDVEDAKALQKQIDELIFKMSKMSASEKGFDPLGADKALEKIHNELQKNSGMSKEAKRQIQSYYDEIRSGNPSKPIKDLLDDMYKLIQLEREAGRAHKSFTDIFKEKVVYGAAANLAGMIGIYDIINVGRQAVDIVIDLNTQITELAKVSEDSMSQIYDDFNSYAEIAKDIGGTISDTISATSDWSRNGYSIPDSKELAKVALLYKNVGDGIDIDTANESLISTLRGFRMEAEDAMHIIDVFNEVDTLASYYSNVMALCGNT